MLPRHSSVLMNYHTEQSALCPLPYTQAYRRPRLASIALIDRRARESTPLPPREHGQMAVTLETSSTNIKDTSDVQLPVNELLL